MTSESNSAARASAALHRLLAAVYRSWPNYLADAGQWLASGDEQLAQTLTDIAADQQKLARRLGQLLIEREASAQVPNYPIEYADSHFLSLKYLGRKLVDSQRQVVATAERAVAATEGDAEGRALAEEALGASKAHLEMLEGLARRG